MRPSEADATYPLVLLLEDDAALSKALRFALKVEGYSAEILESAEALLERVFPEGSVCIIADLHLPGMSGLEALEILHQRGIRAPAILTTTQPTSALRDRARDIAATVVEKPILGNSLAEAVRDCWRGGRRKVSDRPQVFSTR